MRQFSLSKKDRLVSNEQFRSVLARKQRASDDLLIVYLAQNDSGFRRLGVSVGKSCGSAVVRNRLKRLIREAFRLSKDQLPDCFDYLIMICPAWRVKFNNKEDIKKAAVKLKSQEVQASLLALMAKLRKKTDNFRFCD